MLEHKPIVRSVSGDITAMPVEAIVHAANSHLWMGSGAAGAIKAKAGADIEKEAMARGPIKIGQAIATGSGQMALPIRRIIHMAVYTQELETDLGAIRQATLSALQLADAEGVRSLAIPVIQGGNLSLSAVALLMEGTIETMLEATLRLRDVYLVFPSPDDLAEFRLRQPH
ncbi:MAG: macro domain-containing protein [Candidatus Sericytochromatia bacterium]|nr:macro domain-containing protein [Candidatus Sericytochromatia bacterium]